MSLNTFIPEVWADQLLMNLHKQYVFAQPGIVNRNYEGDIASAGDTVRINAIGPVTISDYTKNSDLTAPEELSAADTVLQITQSKAFNFQVDDVDRRQAQPEFMTEAMREAGSGLADALDQYIAGLYTGVDAANVSGSTAVPIALTTAADAYVQLVTLGKLLSLRRIPKEGRWIIVPPEFTALLQQDARFTDASASGTTDVLLNGIVRRAAGFSIVESLNVPVVATTKYKIMAGYPGAITLAEQINKVEGYRMEKRFADGIKGLHLYGAKLVRPQGIAVLTATF
jgi:hypothetical protein